MLLTGLSTLNSCRLNHDHKRDQQIKTIDFLLYMTSQALIFYAEMLHSDSFLSAYNLTCITRRD